MKASCEDCKIEIKFNYADVSTAANFVKKHTGHNMHVGNIGELWQPSLNIWLRIQIELYDLY
jgi:hypothetical protein